MSYWKVRQANHTEDVSFTYFLKTKMLGHHKTSGPLTDRSDLIKYYHFSKILPVRSVDLCMVDDLDNAQKSYQNIFLKLNYQVCDLCIL